MKLISEIREYLASIPSPGIRKLQTLPDNFTAYVIRLPEGHGVAIEVDDHLAVSERFNSIRLYTTVLSFDGNRKNYLILRSSYEQYRYEFASICADFVDPGEQGSYRAALLNDPRVWWSKWKELVGNTSRDQRVYDVIAELMVLDYKYQKDKSTEWAATKMGSHDIECTEESCEVKSTLKRLGTEITISSQYQLEHKKPLYLYFCRLEESLEGLSINDLEKELIKHGFNSTIIEQELEKHGFEIGASSRDKKYKKLEGRVYEINEKFPRIVQSSFKNDKYPDAIIHIQYTIDLEGIDYITW